MSTLLVWCLLFWISLRIRKWGLRRLDELGKTDRVSRNPQTGKKWEQIAPMDECFDDEEDDLYG